MRAFMVCQLGGDFYQLGEVENEGDVERLTARHLAQHGHDHIEAISLIFEGTPEYQRVYPDQPEYDDEEATP